MGSRTLLTIIAVLLIAQPADSGPSISSLDKRERAHYKNLDQRLKLLTEIYNSGPSHTVEFASMQPGQNSSGATFYIGVIACPEGYIATGGGTDWGLDTPRGDWVVLYSHPATGGHGWEAEIFAGRGAPTVTPRIYVSCIAH